MSKKKQGKRNNKGIALNIILVLSCLVFLFSLGKLAFSFLDTKQLKEDESEILDIIYETKEAEAVFNQDTFEQLQQTNSEFQAWLSFDSRFIELPIVQTVDNSYYLKHSFNKKTSSRGTVFMDYRNSWDDQNIILYGHYVYSDSSSMFTPLEQLHDKEQFLANQTLKLYGPTSVRSYKLMFLYIFDEEVEQDFDYTVSQFSSEKAFHQFIQEIKARDTLGLDEEILATDKLLTLQTCVRNKEFQRLILVAKLIDEQLYEAVNQ